MILPSLAFWSSPRLVLSAILARSYLPSWSRMPSVSSPSGRSSPIVQGADLRAALLELAPEEVVVGRFPREAVPVLREHHRDVPSLHEVPHPVHPRPLEACPALAGVRDLLEDLVALFGGVLSQSLQLLGEGVAGASGD